MMMGSEKRVKIPSPRPASGRQPRGLYYVKNQGTSARLLLGANDQNLEQEEEDLPLRARLRTQVLDVHGTHPQSAKEASDAEDV